MAREESLEEDSDVAWCAPTKARSTRSCAVAVSDSNFHHPLTHASREVAIDDYDLPNILRELRHISRIVGDWSEVVDMAMGDATSYQWRLNRLRIMANIYYNIDAVLGKEQGDSIDAVLGKEEGDLNPFTRVDDAIRGAFAKYVTALEVRGGTLAAPLSATHSNLVKVRIDSLRWCATETRILYERFRSSCNSFLPGTSNFRVSLRFVANAISIDRVLGDIAFQFSETSMAQFFCKHFEAINLPELDNNVILRVTSAAAERFSNYTLNELEADWVLRTNFALRSVIFTPRVDLFVLALHRCRNLVSIGEARTGSEIATICMETRGVLSSIRALHTDKSHQLGAKGDSSWKSILSDVSSVLANEREEYRHGLNEYSSFVSSALDLSDAVSSGDVVAGTGSGLSIATNMAVLFRGIERDGSLKAFLGGMGGLGALFVSGPKFVKALYRRNWSAALDSGADLARMIFDMAKLSGYASKLITRLGAFATVYTYVKGTMIAWQYGVTLGTLLRKHILTDEADQAKRRALLMYAIESVRGFRSNLSSVETTHGALFSHVKNLMKAQDRASAITTSALSGPDGDVGRAREVFGEYDGMLALHGLTGKSVFGGEIDEVYRIIGGEAGSFLGIDWRVNETRFRRFPPVLASLKDDVKKMLDSGHLDASLSIDAFSVEVRRQIGLNLLAMLAEEVVGLGENALGEVVEFFSSSKGEALKHAQTKRLERNLRQTKDVLKLLEVDRELADRIRSPDAWRYEVSTKDAERERRRKPVYEGAVPTGGDASPRRDRKNQ